MLTYLWRQQLTSVQKITVLGTSPRIRLELRNANSYAGGIEILILRKGKLTIRKMKFSRFRFSNADNRAVFSDRTSFT